MEDLGDINYSASGDRPQKLEVKDQLTIVLKEYDSLRKQIDQGSAFMQSLVIPLSVAIGGAMIGWKGKPPELAVFVLPVVIMCGLAIAQHGEAYTEYSGRLLALVEDRVFQISGMPLLCHETKLAVKRKVAGGRGWWLAVFIVSVAYAACELWLFRTLGSGALNSLSNGMMKVARTGASVPVLYAIVMAARFQWSRHRWSATSLAEHLYTQGQLPRQAAKLFGR
jgi:hypothetical protein